MRAFRTFTATALAVLAVLAPARADQILGQPRTDGSSRAQLPGGPTLGTWKDGKFTSKPDAVEIQGAGSTGPVDGMSVGNRSLGLWLTAGRAIELAWYGADAKGATDSTSAVQAAVNAACAMGGANIHVSGVFKLLATINIPCSNVKFLAPANDARHDAPPNSPATQFNNTQPSGAFLWAGPTGGTMVQFKPSAGQAAALGGIGSIGVAYFCSVYPNTANIAAYGLVIRGAVDGEFDVFAQECGIANVYTGAIVDNSSTVEGSTRNLRFRRLEGRNITTTGALLKLDGTTGKGNTYNSTFGMVSGLYNNGPGLVFGASDNNTLGNVRLQRLSGGTGVGVIFAASANSDTPAGGNIIHLLSPGGGGVVAQGTESATYASVKNKIEWYNPEENGAPVAPTIGTDATLYWRSIQAVGAMDTVVQISTAQSVASGSFVKINWNALINGHGDYSSQFNAAAHTIAPRWAGWHTVTFNVTLTNPDTSAVSYQAKVQTANGQQGIRTIKTVAARATETLTVIAPIFFDGTSATAVSAYLLSNASRASNLVVSSDLTNFSVHPSP